jgi:hypothetical protein
MADVLTAIWSGITGLSGIVRTALAFKKPAQRTAPLVRVVGMFPPTMLILGPGATAPPPTKMLLDLVKLKNVGGGPALAVKMFDRVTSALMLEVDVVEPLGPGPDEAHRLGAVEKKLMVPMELSRGYGLYYQDVSSTWHLTSFTPRPTKIECEFLGPQKDSEVPPEVRSLGIVAKT